MSANKKPGMEFFNQLAAKLGVTDQRKAELEVMIPEMIKNHHERLNPVKVHHDVAVEQNSNVRSAFSANNTNIIAPSKAKKHIFKPVPCTSAKVRKVDFMPGNASSNSESSSVSRSLRTRLNGSLNSSKVNVANDLDETIIADHSINKKAAAV